VVLTLVAFVVTISVIVTLHELGHFLAARLMGMRVKRFSIGFPPCFYTHKFGETEFSLCWIPLGGYVQIAGMVDESLEEGGITGAPDEFMSKNPLQKVFTLSAGVLMNYITAFLIIAGLTAVMGVSEVSGTSVAEVLSGMPAIKAGVHAGDKIIAVNGENTPTWQNIVERISTTGDTVALTLTRAPADTFVVRMATQAVDDGGGKRRVVGIAPQVTVRSASVGDVASRGWSFCAGTSSGIVHFLFGLATGQSSIAQISGPLGVAKLSGESARQGGGAFLFFIAYVSVSIGFLNILPFPALDGGHVLYVVIEAIIRRPIPTKVKLWLQQVGMALLILLIVFVSYHDIIRMFTN
jgi:regulator of sigma E protease